MPVAEQTDWLDGPRLVEWLEDHGLDNIKAQLGSSLERPIRDWRYGTAASIYTVDKILVRLGCHLSELPEDLFTDSPLVTGFSAPIGEEKRREIKRRAKAGEGTAAISRAVGVSPSTVRRWRDA
jgi:hypothetical protein